MPSCTQLGLHKNSKVESFHAVPFLPFLTDYRQTPRVIPKYQQLLPLLVRIAGPLVFFVEYESGTTR